MLNRCFTYIKDVIVISKMSMITVLVFSVFFTLQSVQAHSKQKLILTTIRPLQLILQEIAGDQFRVEYLLDAGRSVHNIMLKPSDVKKIISSSRIFIVDSTLETSFVRSLKKLNFMNRTVTLTEIEGINLLKNRDKNFWLQRINSDKKPYHIYDNLNTSKEHEHEEHEHKEHEHEEHDHEEHGHEEDEHEEHGHEEHEHEEHGHEEYDHEEDEHEEHGHEEHEHEEHGHEEYDHEEDEHDHGYYDPHIWLSIQNAITIANHAANVFGDIDKVNATLYKKRVANFVLKLKEARQDIKNILSTNKTQSDVTSVKKQKEIELNTSNNSPVIEIKPYLISHDAYQYFENEFFIQPRGIIFYNNHSFLSIPYIRKLQKILQKENIRCVIYELPSAKLDNFVKTFFKDNNVKLTHLDLLVSQADNFHSYRDFIVNIANTLSDCLRK